MSTGKLKAQYNRVRTSTALHTTSIWSNTIGLQTDTGTNAAIEAQIYAPGGGKGGREAKQKRAQELIEATGYEPSVRDFNDLRALARRSGGDAMTNRGACKICGGLGHLTKQCRNLLGGSGRGDPDAPADGGGERALLTAEDEAALLMDSDSDSSGSGSGLSSDSGGRKRRKRDKSGRSERSSKKHKKEKSSSKKHKRERERERSSKKAKRERRERSRSRSRDRDHEGRRGERDRSRSRSRERR